MKKKPFFLYFICVLLCASTIISFCGCVKVDTPSNVSENFENLAADGSFVQQGENAGDEAVLSFGENKSFNTVALKENGNSVCSYSIYVDGVMVYESDFIGKYKYCALPTAYTSDKITIKVNECASDKQWEIYKPEVYLVENTCRDDFRVMSYIYCDKAIQLSDEDRKIIGVTTQFNLINCLYLFADGTIYFKPQTLADGTVLGGEEAFRLGIEKLREFNPSASVVATILGSDDIANDGLDQETRHDTAMTDNKETFISNILQLIEDYSLDGVAFDYEYPYSPSTYRHYGNFLKDLKLAMPAGKELNCAFCEWNLYKLGTFPISKLEYVDNIELMTYDGFDENGNHSTFYKMCAEALAQLKKKGVDLSKVNLGLPFYSRPIDRAAYWGSYVNVAPALGKYKNSIYETINVNGNVYEQLCYYNCWQMIYDKTSYAVDVGAGGVMIWNYGCDTTDEELSLYGAIGQAKANRKSHD